MKRNKIASRVLSCVLAFAMIIGTCSTAFAAGASGGGAGGGGGAGTSGSIPSVPGSVPSPHRINYVSLGDSMTNGYGLPGYDGNTGVEDYGNGSYANLFAEWLDEGYEGTVDHKQLAMSAMRAEDLHWLLELDYNDTAAIDITDADYDDGRWADFGEAAWNEKFTTGDFWTWNELCDDYRLAVAAYAIENHGNYGKITDDEAAIVAEYYQNAVKDADIISLGMGNGNFGVFAFGRIMEAIGFGAENKEVAAAKAMIYKVERAIAECDAEMQAKILELKDTLLAKVAPLRATVGAAFSDTQWNALLNTVVYTGLSYVLNYAGSVEAILQLNPDAEIILVALMNTFAEPGATVDYTNISTIGDIMGAIFEPLNMFIAGLPTYMQAVGNGVYKDAVFYYAEAPEVDCLVEVYGTEITNPSSVIRSRFVESIVGTSTDPGMVWGLLAPMVPGMTGGSNLEWIDIDDILLYSAKFDTEKAGYAASGNKDKAISCALYLAFENAIVNAAEATVDLASVMNLGNLSGDIFGGVMAEFSANIDAAGETYKATVIDLIEPLVRSGINDGLSANGVPATLDADTVKALLAGSVTAEIVVETGMGIPAVHPAFATIVSGINAGIAEGQANVDALCMLLALPETLSAALATDDAINGLLGLFARCIIGNGLGAHPSASGHIALKDALVKAYSEGYTAQDETIKNVTALIKEYYDEAYAYAYAKADEEGYIDAAVAAIDNAIAVITALDLDGVEMTDDFRAKLEVEVAQIVATLIEIKGILAEDKASDVEGLIQSVSALWDDLNTHLTNAGAILAQAEFDIKTLVVPVVDAYVSALVESFKDTAKTEIAKVGHKHYETDEDSYYVAIGGDTVIGQNLDYYDKRYQQLIKEEYGIDYKRIAQEKLLSADVLPLIIENASEIAKADLITYQLDATNFIWSTLDVEADWDKYINEYLKPEERELVEKIVDETIRVLTMDWNDHADTKISELVEKIKVAVLSKLPEDVPFVEDIFDSLVDFLLPYIQNEIVKAEEKVNDSFELDEKIDKIEDLKNKIASIDETTKEYIEKFAFAFVAYAIETAKAVEAIETINPDATLVVVGMYNPLRGLEIKIGENAINVEEYFEYVIKATNHYYSLLSMTDKGFAFVDVAEAETNGFNTIIDVANMEQIAGKLVSMAYKLPSIMNANADGHGYIKDQIVAALTCTYGAYEKVDKVNHAKECSICGHEVIDEHDLSYAKYNATYHTVKCSICDYEEKEKHDFSGKTCTLCGYVKSNGGASGGGGGVVSNQFTIKFETNGGSAVASVTVKKDELLAEPAAPTKEGFVFDGWYTDKALTAKYDFSTPVKKSFTLYAKWSKGEFKNPFIDVKKEDWFYDAVMFVFEKGITKGISDTEYAPQGKVTRAQFITMLCRAYEIEEMAGDNFADCGDAWYTGYLAAAKQLGISNGVGDNMFAPEKEITREEMVTLIYNYLKSINQVTEETTELSFADGDDVSEWAKTAVAYAAKNGIVNGKENNIFDPNGTATRAELAQIFYNMFK